MKETFTSRNRFTQAGMRTGEQGSGSVELQKVTLIVEYGQDPTSEIIVLRNLNRLLNPETIALTLIHAEFDWLSEGTASVDEVTSSGLTLSEKEMILRKANETARQELTDAGFNIVHEMDCGFRDKNLKALVKTLEEAEQDLLVIAEIPARDERSKASHFAFNLATQAPVSVLMLRDAVALSPNPVRMLLGVDGSEASMNAVRKLGQILDTRNSQLTLVTAQSPIYQENAVLAPYVNQSVLDEALDANAGIIFEMVTDILENQGIGVSERQKLIGSPATELGNLAELEHPDLIVVGSHNRKGVLAWLMGSVSSQLLHWDNHNLLVVR